MNAFVRVCLSIVPIMAIGIGLLWPAAALADGPATGTQMAISAPETVKFGESVHISATLADASGKPVPKATVKFYAPVTFLAGVSGLELLDQATTDARGVAAIDFVPRRTESLHIVAQFEGDSLHSSTQAEVTAMVTGNHQLYQAEAGIRVPFVNKWILVGVLSFVWGLYFLVVNLVLRIASTSN